MILEESLRRSVRDLSRRTKLSATSVWTILKVELKKFAYKIKIKQKQTVNNKMQWLKSVFSTRLVSEMQTFSGLHIALTLIHALFSCGGS